MQHDIMKLMYIGMYRFGMHACILECILAWLYSVKQLTCYLGIFAKCLFLKVGNDLE